MPLERSLHLAGISRIAVQHLIVGDQALCTFRQKHFVTELYRFAHLAALDEMVWGSKIEYTFSSTGTCSPSMTLRRV